MNKRKLLAITGVLVMILSGCANTSGAPASAEATTEASSAAAETSATASEAAGEASSEATEATNAATSEATAASEASSEAAATTATEAASASSDASAAVSTTGENASGSNSSASVKGDSSAASDSSDAASKVLDEAIAGNIPVHVKEESGKESTYYITDLPHDKTDALSYYEAGERIDLDNDGEKELVIEGPYGGIYVDARGQEVYELARGDGTALQLYHADYNGKTYICHVDNSHGGREIFKMDQFNGKGEIVESTELVAEFWDTGYFDESADCHFGKEKISTDRYLELRKEIFDY